MEVYPSNKFDALNDLSLALLRLRKDAIEQVVDRTLTETIDIVAAETLRALEMRFDLTPKEIIGDYKECKLAMHYYGLVNDNGEY